MNAVLSQVTAADLADKCEACGSENCSNMWDSERKCCPDCTCRKVTARSCANCAHDKPEYVSPCSSCENESQWEPKNEETSAHSDSAELALREIGEILAANGCECDCDHHHDECDENCKRCLGCRIGNVLYLYDKKRGAL